MITSRKLAAIATLSAALSVVGCHGDYLTGGELSTDPNRPTTATTKNLFTTVQSNLWDFWGGDPSRVTSIYAQQYSGNNRQYQALDQTYSQDPTTTNGFHTALYTAGGLIDIDSIEVKSKASGDSIFLGIAQITEGALMGTGADLFGDLVYSQALKGTPNPALDPQAQVYDSVQKVISAGIANLTAAKPGGTNVGPGSSDRVYGGSPAKWIALGHTLKARFYLHTGSVNPTAYANALAEAKLGIKSNTGNYFGAFTTKSGEENFFYQFNDVQRGDASPGATLDSILLARNDPRDSAYFQRDKAGNLSDFSNAVQAPDAQTPYVTYDENTLIWAESAYRTGDQATALAKLNEERVNNGLAPETGLTGLPLLNEILTEEYISDFMLGEEAWLLYNRTCTPNLVPNTTKAKIPGRLFYDSGEQQTNTNIPTPGTGINGFRNALTPAKATSDGTGAKCLGQ